MTDLSQVAAAMNTIAAFVGPRDADCLEPNMVDIAVLFGGSIVAGGDVFAQAMRVGAAKTYVVVGGAGHTTPSLRARMRELAPGARFADDASEAEVFLAYLRERYGLEPDYLETKSTNCGNNITFLLDLLREKGLEPASALFVQDATMQRRMAAGMALHAPEVRVVNYAAYQVRVVEHGGALAYEDEPVGMWDVERYRTLLMGEVPRLTDDEGGYGPAGKGYIAHVDVPTKVREAFEFLRGEYPDQVRVANPAFA